MSKDETAAALVKQLENPALTEREIDKIERKLEILDEQNK